MKGIFYMEWTTLYIAGKIGFKEEVLKNLESSKFPYLPGAPENDSVSLFWIDERSSLRDFKKAIGSKTVFKYRLQFFPSLEKYYESIRNNKAISFSPKEQALISEMSSKLPRNRLYKNTA